MPPRLPLCGGAALREGWLAFGRPDGGPGYAFTFAAKWRPTRQAVSAARISGAGAPMASASAPKLSSRRSRWPMCGSMVP